MGHTFWFDSSPHFSSRKASLVRNLSPPRSSLVRSYSPSWARVVWIRTPIEVFRHGSNESPAECVSGSLFETDPRVSTCRLCTRIPSKFTAERGGGHAAQLKARRAADRERPNCSLSVARAGLTCSHPAHELVERDRRT